MLLNIGEESIETAPENTTLYTFAGQLAVFDHVFVRLSPVEEQLTGAYIFNLHQPKLYKRLFKLAAQDMYPSLLNMLQVAECDQNALIRAETKDLQQLEAVPEDWA